VSGSLAVSVLSSASNSSRRITRALAVSPANTGRDYRGRPPRIFHAFSTRSTVTRNLGVRACVASGARRTQWPKLR
jgi:hypothetical protein